ncbi:MAG: hypothetical protein PHO83_04815 [Geobacteraceae bacterium]|nr:hypothetical protein [Geobacteraceae bacterium]
MNRNRLRLSLQPDDDGTGELCAEVSANGFSGKGSAYFDLRHLAELSENFMAYPLCTERLPIIVGGYWSKNKNELEQTHLLIKAYPIGCTGELGVRIELATPLYESDRPESQLVVKVEIKTDYNGLESFGKQLSQLAKLRREEAILMDNQV